MSTNRRVPGATEVMSDGAVVSLSNPVPVGSPHATHADKSGAITTGGTAQVAIAANTNRRGFFIQASVGGDLYINTTGTATAVDGGGSIRIPGGSLYECPANGVPTTSISIIGSITGQKFSAKEW